MAEARTTRAVPDSRLNQRPESPMDRDAPPRDGFALLQRYCNENARSAQWATRKPAQVIDFIMGRDGFEPSTSGLKVVEFAR